MKPDLTKITGSVRAFAEKLLHPRQFWLVLLGVCFLISFFFWVFSPPVRACTLFFQDARTHKLVPVQRFIPRQSTAEAEIRSLLEELFLGPAQERLLLLTVPHADVNSVIRSGKTFYVDLSADILFGTQLQNEIYQDALLPFNQLLSIVEKVLHQNFPSFSFILTINGMQSDQNSVPATKINNLIDKGTTMAIINIK